MDFGPRFRGPLRHWHDDVFRAQAAEPLRGDLRLTFQVESGRVHALKVHESPWAPDWYDDRDDLGDFQRP